jgi:predicted  nucleic acid-binding Zn-ribbon protein
MSINYKKMADLIEQEVNKISELSIPQKERLSKLSNKLYTLESSIDAISTQKMVDEIMKEIKLASSDFSENGVKQ